MALIPFRREEQHEDREPSENFPPSNPSELARAERVARLLRVQTDLIILARDPRTSVEDRGILSEANVMIGRVRA